MMLTARTNTGAIENDCFAMRAHAGLPRNCRAFVIHDTRLVMIGSVELASMGLTKIYRAHFIEPD